jgi:hypothetical protein
MTPVPPAGSARSLTPGRPGQYDASAMAIRHCQPGPRARRMDAAGRAGVATDERPGTVDLGTG